MADRSFDDLPAKSALVLADEVAGINSENSPEHSRFSLSDVKEVILSNAQPADLGFDPATQAELNAHINDTSDPHSVTKSQVGLGNVPNVDTSQATNVSITDSGGNYTASDVEAALAEEADARQAHEGDSSNPHSTTKSDVGLGNVPNTDATNASNISSGTLPDGQLAPNVDRNVASISDLNSESTADKNAILVTSDVGGLFVARATDPFGNGDDGAVVLQAPDGWWVRREAVTGAENTPYWWGEITSDEPAADTDNRQAFQAAFDQDEPTYIPPGTWHIDQHLDLTSGKIIRGAGAQTEIRPPVGSSGIVVVGERWRISNVTIEYGSVPGSDDGTAAIQLGDTDLAHEAIIDNVRTYKGNAGLGASNAGDAGTFLGTILNARFAAGNFGVKIIGGGAGLTTTTLQQVYCLNNEIKGMDLRNFVGGLTMIGCACDAVNKGKGVSISNCNNVNILNLFFEANIINEFQPLLSINDTDTAFVRGLRLRNNTRNPNDAGRAIFLTVQGSSVVDVRDLSADGHNGSNWNWITTGGNGATVYTRQIEDDGAGNFINSGDKFYDLNEKAGLTTKDTSTVDATYGSEEQSVIQNNRTRIEEIESKLQSHGVID